MKITINHDELAEIEALLPESAKVLIQTLGYKKAVLLINQFGGVSLTAKSREAKERSGGVYSLLRDILSEDDLAKLIQYIGGEHFYIPRCDAALRQLRNARFVEAVAERQSAGLSIRQAFAILCPEFGISDRIGWELIRTRAMRGKAEQPGLFDE